MKIRLLTFLLLLFLLGCCRSQSDGPYTYIPPVETEDGLTVGTLSDVNMNTELVTKAITQIRKGRYRQIHSLLVYKDGKLVLEEYFEGHTYQWDAPGHEGKRVHWDRDMIHSIMSDTKSITSACIGIAVDKGFIKDVDQSIFDYLPQHQHLKAQGKGDITIEHLLTMTSGLEWYEWGTPYSSTENPIIGIWFSDKDPVSFILEGQLVAEPGTKYSYYGGHQILLGEILHHASGMKIDEFSAKYLFQPLGIETAQWSVAFDNGVIEAAGGLKLRPRDMLKIGILYLDNGTWRGEQIISEQWIRKSAVPYAGNTEIRVPGETSYKRGYSYSWWTDQLDHRGKKIKAFHAGGWGGQKILIIPGLNAVIVFTGGDYLSKLKQFKLLEKYVLPAMP